MHARSYRGHGVIVSAKRGSFATRVILEQVAPISRGEGQGEIGAFCSSQGAKSGVMVGACLATGKRVPSLDRRSPRVKMVARSNLGGSLMRKLVQSLAMSAAFAAVVTFSAMQFAHAISADLARKCRELAIKSHPPTVVGSSKGAAQAERDSFRQCVARGGKADSDPKGQQ